MHGRLAFTGAEMEKLTELLAFLSSQSFGFPPQIDPKYCSQVMIQIIAAMIASKGPLLCLTQFREGIA
jgi:hypothetical protein